MASIEHPVAPADTAQPALWRLLVIGVFTGFFGGLFGLGGGVIIVPALVMLCGFNQRIAAATSSLAILPTALVGITSYALHGAVDWLAGLALAVGVFCGSQIGGLLLKRLSLRALEWCFFGFLLIAIVSLWVVIPPRDATIEMSPLIFILLVLFGLIPGVAVVLLGVGGGIIAIPVLIAGFGANDILAKGTSMLVVVVGAFTSAAKHLRSGMARAKIAFTIGVTAAIITPFSVQLAIFMPPLWSNILFSLFLAFIASQYLRRLLKNSSYEEQT